MIEGNKGLDLTQYISHFEAIPVGEVMSMPLFALTPTQSRDAGLSRSTGRPVEAFCDRGRVLIQNGNHRYHEKLDLQMSNPDEPIFLQAKKVPNPYINF